MATSCWIILGSYRLKVLDHQSCFPGIVFCSGDPTIFIIHCFYSILSSLLNVENNMFKDHRSVFHVYHWEIYSGILSNFAVENWGPLRNSIHGDILHVYTSSVMWVCLWQEATVCFLNVKIYEKALIFVVFRFPQNWTLRANKYVDLFFLLSLNL